MCGISFVMLAPHWLEDDEKTHAQQWLCHNITLLQVVYVVCSFLPTSKYVCHIQEEACSQKDRSKSLGPLAVQTESAGEEGEFSMPWIDDRC